MSAADAAKEIAEVAADGVADGMHVVGEEALALEAVTRGLQAVNLAYFGLGLAAGAAIGGFAAWKVAYAKAEAKYSEISATEIAEARDHYNDKVVALENEASKGDLEEIVRERGYVSEEADEPEMSASPPMAVTPPAAVRDRAAEIAESEDEAAGEPPDDEGLEVAPEPVTRNVFRDHGEPEDVWDWPTERAQRSPLRPYVIHLDEREERQAYDVVTYTYYEQDDVVCNERDEPLSEEERERIIGEENLGKFGHGSRDATVVYVRNDKLEMDMEIIQSPNSFAEEVHGFEPEIKHSYRRRERIHDHDE
jgi:hypothetical protein